MKESFRYCVYIPSRNREKQLCNKAIEEAILKACAYKKHCNTISEQAENSFISEI
jgi:hypothetical protein